jgi:hypothetical protein
MVNRLSTISIKVNIASLAESNWTKGRCDEELESRPWFLDVAHGRRLGIDRQ